MDGMFENTTEEVLAWNPVNLPTKPCTTAESLKFFTCRSYKTPRYVLMTVLAHLNFSLMKINVFFRLNLHQIIQRGNVVSDRKSKSCPSNAFSKLLMVFHAIHHFVFESNDIWENRCECVAESPDVVIDVCILQSAVLVETTKILSL